LAIITGARKALTNTKGTSTELGRIEETVLVRAPLEKVWDLLVDIENYPTYCKFIKRAQVTQHPRGKKSCDMVGAKTRMVFEIAGMRMEVEAVEAEYFHLKKFVRRGVSGMRFEASALTSTTVEGTLLKCLMNYDLPYGILGKIMDRVFFVRAMERNIERSLDTIKEALEGRVERNSPTIRTQSRDPRVSKGEVRQILGDRHWPERSTEEISETLGVAQTVRYLRHSDDSLPWNLSGTSIKWSSGTQRSLPERRDRRTGSRSPSSTPPGG
jgi:uncharacterized membrane protein